MDIASERFDKLSPKEVKFINSILSEHGKIKDAMVITGLSRAAIKRAKEGFPITKESASIIREKLLNN